MKIIKVGAVWCPGCLVMRPIWKSLEEELTEYEIIEYDYDIDEEEIEKYDVGTKLPVVILMDNDKELGRIKGEKTKEEILEFLRSYKK